MGWRDHLPLWRHDHRLPWRTGRVCRTDLQRRRPVDVGRGKPVGVVHHRRPQWRPAGLHFMLLLAALTAVGPIALAPALRSGKFYKEGTYTYPRHRWRQLSISAPCPVLSVTSSTTGRSEKSVPARPAFSSTSCRFSEHSCPPGFLDEIPRLFHFVGIALIFLGIYLTTSRTPH